MNVPRIRRFRPSVEPLEDRRLLAATITVNSIADLDARDNALTLREAILINNRTLEVANLTAAEQTQISGTPSASDTDTIGFNLPGSGIRTITPTAVLPTITDPVVIDGYTQPGAAPNSNPLELGAGAVGINATLLVRIAGGSTLDGLVITAGSSTVRGLVLSTFRNQIVLSEAGNNVIVGNFFGTAGGTGGEGGGPGVRITSGSGNRIGSDADGVNDPAERNVISTDLGVEMVGAVSNTVIQGNFVGTSAAGTARLEPVPSRHGIVIGAGVSGTRIGGVAAGAGNLLSGLEEAAIQINGGSSTLVQGNFIGTDPTGTSAVPNGIGVHLIDASQTTIGGTTAAARNVISGNNSTGIEVTGTSNQTLIQGNIIGLSASGTAEPGNSGGIRLDSTQPTIVGGTVPGAANVISGNQSFGVFVAGSGNQVQGNLIGTRPDGVSPAGNLGPGVRIAGFNTNVRGFNNTIGGIISGAGNIIAFNRISGVVVNAETVFNQPNVGNAILGNRMFLNASKGIQLVGTTANDAGDADAGPNNRQNFPEIGAAERSGSALRITYTVSSSPDNSSYPIRVEFFEADADGAEGQTLLGFDAFSAADFATGSKTVTLAAAGALLGDALVATATDASGNTSEFSPASEITQGEPPPDTGLPEIDIDTLNEPGAPGSAALVEDADHPGQTVLLVTGTARNDVILIEPRPSNLAQVRVKTTGALLGIFSRSSASRILVFGRAGNDTIVVDSRLNVSATLLGEEGNDQLFGGRGNDELSGGPGNDRLFGGAGADTLSGGEGNDQLYGQQGNDLVGGAAGNDKLFGEAGSDILLGGTGNDYLYGGGGNDGLLGEAGNDQLFGEGGNDALAGGEGNDKLFGGGGRDLLSGGVGSDFLFGEAGDDLLVGGSTAFDDDLDGTIGVLARWASSGSYSSRVGKLRGGGESDIVLDESSILEDGQRDELFGGGGRDWFLVGTNDRVRDRAHNELLN